MEIGKSNNENLGELQVGTGTLLASEMTIRRINIGMLSLANPDRYFTILINYNNQLIHLELNQNEIYLLNNLQITSKIIYHYHKNEFLISTVINLYFVIVLCHIHHP